MRTPPPTPSSARSGNRRHLPWLLAALGGLLLTSCATDRTPTADLDEPIFGSSHATTYIVAPTDGQVHVSDLAKVARVLRRYKTLDAREKALVQSSVARRLNGLIALEVQTVQPRYEAERARIARLPDRRVAAQQEAALNESIQREATARVLRRLGSLVAVPLKTSDNRSAVAFARIGGAAPEVLADAAEIDKPIASLMEGAKVQAGSGQVAALVKGMPVAVAAGR